MPCHPFFLLSYDFYSDNYLALFLQIIQYYWPDCINYQLSTTILNCCYSLLLLIIHITFYCGILFHLLFFFQVDHIYHYELISFINYFSILLLIPVFYRYFLKNFQLLLTSPHICHYFICFLTLLQNILSIY